MGIFRKIGNAMARFMYGRNGMDQLNLALVFGCLALDLAAMFTGDRSALAATVFYWAGLALWGWILFRVFSRNLQKRRSENAKFMGRFRGMQSKWQSAKTRRADKEHKYIPCKSCKAVCRVPVGKGKIEITCPKCGTKIQAKT